MSPYTAQCLARYSLMVTILEALLAPGTILVIAVILETEAEDHKFKSSLDNFVRPCFTIKKCKELGM